MASRRVLHDRFFKQAKEEGYLARSAYKLMEIDRRFRLMRTGARVLDLGCAPGAWIQVALEAVGPRGVVIGIDLKEVRTAFGPNARVIQGDAYRVPPEELVALAGRPFDVVLSDMAPDTTGHGDHFLSVRLCRRVLELLPGVLRPGGHLCYKVFEGEEYPALLKQTAAQFGSARGFKPEASREVSVEMYVIAREYRGPSGPPVAGGVKPRGTAASAEPRRGGAT